MSRGLVIYQTILISPAKNLVSFDVKDVEGKSIANKNFKNKIVLYNFWFEGCKYYHNLFEPLNELF